MQNHNCVSIDEATKTYYLEGVYDKFTIPEHWKVLKPLLKTTLPENISLARLIDCDSALIALLVEIKRENKALKIHDLPENLEKLLDLYQVKALFL